MQHFEEEVVEDFVGWVFLQLCVQVAVIFYAWTMLGMLENVWQKHDESNGHSCYSSSRYMQLPFLF